jgi:hypothetical protein
MMYDEIHSWHIFGRGDYAKHNKNVNVADLKRVSKQKNRSRTLSSYGNVIVWRIKVKWAFTAPLATPRRVERLPKFPLVLISLDGYLLTRMKSHAFTLALAWSSLKAKPTAIVECDGVGASALNNVQSVIGN